MAKVSRHLVRAATAKVQSISFAIGTPCFAPYNGFLFQPEGHL
jgi:hypothetical protein